MCVCACVFYVFVRPYIVDFEGKNGFWKDFLKVGIRQTYIERLTKPEILTCTWRGLHLCNIDSLV